MDNFSLVAVVAILALVVVAMLLVFRSRAKIDLKGPGGTGLKMDASNEPTPPTPAIDLEGVKSKSGKVTVTDETARGIKGKDISGDKGVDVTAKAPQEKTNPKA